MRDENNEFIVKTVVRASVSKTTTGGRVKSMRVLVVVGDKKGKIGVGAGKAKDSADAQKKAERNAYKNLIQVPIINGTIPHNTFAKNGATKVQINSAKQGTGIIAGGVVRDVMHVAGISDIVSKIIGSSSPHNTIYATFNALKQLHSVESIAARLGKTAKEIRSRYFFKKI